MPRGEGIKSINQLFDKYKKQLIAPQSSVVKAFCEVVADLYNLEVKTKEVTYSTYSKTISLKTPSTLKNEIKLHQK